MNSFTDRGQPSQPRPDRRRAMGTRTGILLITTGAVLRFALAAGSPHGLNLHAAGVILMLAGLLGLLLPPLAGDRSSQTGCAAGSALASRTPTTRHPPEQMRASTTIARHWSTTATFPTIMG